MPAVGDTVAADAELPDGQKAYEMPDGTCVLVQEDPPLPTAVTESINATVFGLYDPAASFATARTAQARGYQLQAKTGKDVLVLTRLMTSNDVGNYEIWRIPGYNEFDFSTRDEAVTHAQSIIAGQSNPQNWIIAG